ncbi:MAG: Tim44-like domain-containing protein [Mariprofundaceae bacterium]|nr:Tim44-like domain-containing protein [Mariprofundaceae bacterium]
MNKLMILMVMVGVVFLFSSANTAEAKRFGGGSSFGKQRSAPSKQPALNQRTTPAQSAAPQRGSARSGMMGMLGGLAIGGLLGAMFFGGGFEGINFFDLAIIGLIGFGIFVFMRGRARAATQQDYAYTGGAGDEAIPQHETQDRSSNKHDFSHATARPDIDEKHFLQAAKTIFMRMQQAWDEHNTTDIEQFCTAEVAAKVTADMQADAHRHKTEVAMLDARLVDAWLESDQDWVSVHFTVMMKEETLLENTESVQESSSEVNEIWTFSHDPSGEDPTWYLAGIQQQS